MGLEKYDWIALEREYHCSGMSYKALAEKHGIPISTLKQAAVRLKWSSHKPSKADAGKIRKLRNEVEAVAIVPYEDDVPSRTGSGTAVRYASGGTTRERRQAYFLQLTDEMANRIEDAIRQVDTTNAYAIKLLTGALLDLRTMQGLEKDELDLREQEARIAKLELDANIVEETSGVLVTFEDTEGAEE